MTGQGTIQTAVEAMKAGAFDYILKPFRLQQRAARSSTGRLEVRRLRVENVRLRRFVERLTFESPRYHIVGAEPGDAEGGADDREGRPDRRDGAGPRAERHGQGTGRPGHPRQQRPRRTSRWSRSTAPPSRRTCWRASCSGTRRGRSPAPTRPSRGCSRWPRAARCSSTRWPRWPRPCRRSSCGCWRTGTTGGSAARRSGTPTCAWSRPRTSRWKKREGGPVPRGPVLPAERDRHHAAARCASGARTSRTWSSTCSGPGRSGRSRSPSTPARCGCCAGTTGRGTSANWRTCWNGRRSWPRATPSPPTTCRRTWCRPRGRTGRRHRPRLGPDDLEGIERRHVEDVLRRHGGNKVQRGEGAGRQPPDPVPPHREVRLGRSGRRDAGYASRRVRVGASRCPVFRLTPRQPLECPQCT